MKRILLIFLVALSLRGLGQKIDGFGKIRLGKSYEQIISDLGIKPKEVITGKKMNKVSWLEIFHPREIYLLQFDTLKKYNEGIDLFYIKCPNASKLIIPKIIISGIEITNLQLSFYDNVLYMIYIKDPSSEFTTAFKLKYGQGKNDFKTTKVKCSSVFKDNYEETEYKSNTIWNTETDSLDVSLYQEEYRNNNCEKSFISYFELKLKTTNYIVNDCEMQYRNRIEKKESESLKNKTKDF